MENQALVPGEERDDRVLERGRQLPLEARGGKQAGVGRIGHVAALDQHLRNRREVQPGQVIAGLNGLGLGLSGGVIEGLVGSDSGGPCCGWTALEQATASRPAAMAGGRGLTGVPYCWPLNVLMFSIFHRLPCRTAVTAKSAPA
jgi:hypothetical protein